MQISEESSQNSVKKPETDVPEQNRRLKSLRNRLGLSQAQMAERLGITREWVSNLETGSAKIQELHIYKLDEIEKSLHSEYLSKGSPAPSKAGEIADRRANSSLNLNPAFRSPPEEPTADRCLSYLADYLREISRVPGAVGYTWIQLQKHFSMEEAKRLASQSMAED